MTHVVTQNCVECRFTDCVAVCPVSCFHGDESRVYIDPVACIDCGSCVAACPIHAISEEFDHQSDQQEWISINARLAPTLPVIRGKQPPLPNAEARRAALGF